MSKTNKQKELACGELVSRKRMYKAKKNWVVAGAMLAMGVASLSLSTNVQAEEIAENTVAAQPITENEVDKSELQALVDRVKDTEKESARGVYTDPSWNDFTRQLTIATLVLGNDDAWENEVDQAINNLQRAVDALIAEASVEYKAELQELVNQAETIQKETARGVYLDYSWDDFQRSLVIAEAKLNDDVAWDFEVDQATKNLQLSIDGLVAKASVEYKAGLQELVDKVKGLEQGNYTDETWKNFNRNLAIAEAILKDEDSWDFVIDQTTANLQASIANLQEKV